MAVTLRDVGCMIRQVSRRAARQYFNKLFVLKMDEMGALYFSPGIDTWPCYREYIGEEDKCFEVVRCATCKRKNGLLKCASCNYACYCSFKCQEKDWPLHFMECQIRKHFNSYEEPSVIELMRQVGWL